MITFMSSYAAYFHTMPKSVIEGKRERRIDAQDVSELGCAFGCVGALDNHMRLRLIFLEARTLGESKAKRAIT